MVNMLDLYDDTEERDKKIECLNSAISFYENLRTNDPEIKELLSKLENKKEKLWKITTASA